MPLFHSKVLLLDAKTHPHIQTVWILFRMTEEENEQDSAMMMTMYKNATANKVSTYKVKENFF